MRKAIIAAAAACMVMGSTRADTEPANFVRVVTYIVTATGAVKAVIEAYDWVLARWFPPQEFEAGDLWLCDACEFPPAGMASTPLDDSLGADFINKQFAGRSFVAGQSLVVCDHLQCFLFRYDGEQWFASGLSFKNPGVGYANTPPPAPPPPAAPAPRRGGGGETGAPYAPRSSTVWSPNVVYNPGSRPFGTGTVTVIPGPGVTFGGGGGGGGGRFSGLLEGD